MKEVNLKRSPKVDKKFMVEVGNKTIHFGAKNYSSQR